MASHAKRPGRYTVSQPDGMRMVPVAKAKTCQFYGGGIEDNGHLNGKRQCGKPSLEGYSYCAKHWKICYTRFVPKFLRIKAVKKKLVPSRDYFDHQEASHG